MGELCPCASNQFIPTQGDLLHQIGILRTKKEDFSVGLTVRQCGDLS